MTTFAILCYVVKQTMNCSILIDYNKDVFLMCTHEALAVFFVTLFPMCSIVSSKRTSKEYACAVSSDILLGSLQLLYYCWSITCYGPSSGRILSIFDIKYCTVKSSFLTPYYVKDSVKLTPWSNET
jgi:hypothetical protein